MIMTLGPARQNGDNMFQIVKWWPMVPNAPQLAMQQVFPTSESAEIVAAQLREDMPNRRFEVVPTVEVSA